MARRRIPLFSSLRGYQQRVAARRPRRRPDGVGGAGPRGAGLRDDRRRLAGGRPLRGAAGADAVRRVRQLAASGRPGRWRPRRRCRRPRSPTSRRAARQLRRVHRGARDRHRRAGARSPGLLRLGFLANFISEPVLKGFIIGLALTIIIGQVPKLFGVDKGDGDFFEQLWDFLGNLGDTQGRTLAVGAALARGRARPAAVRAGGARRRWSRWSSASSRSSSSTSTTRASTIVGHIDSGLPSLGLPDELGSSDYFAAAAASVGVMLVGFAEGLGAAKTYAARDHYEIDANRELIGLGAANLGAGLSQRHGRQRQPVEDGGQRLGGRAHAALGAGRRRADGRHAAVPHRAVRGPARGHARRGRDRRASIELVDIPALVAAATGCTRRGSARIYGVAARPDFIAAVAAHARRADLRHAARVCSSASPCRCCCCSTARRARTSPSSARCPGTADQYADLDTPSGERGDSGHRRPARRGRPVLRQRRRRARDGPRPRGASRATRAVVLDAETIPFVDVTAVKMLDRPRRRSAQLGVRLVIAHDIGQVRDLLACRRGRRPSRRRVPDGAGGDRRGLVATGAVSRRRRRRRSSPSTPGGTRGHR